jgi:hypothetical protein
MRRILPAVLAVVPLAACDQGMRKPETASAPTIEVASAIEAPGLTAEVVDRVDQPPPPTPAELRLDRLERWYRQLPTGLQQNVTSSCLYRQQNPCAGVMPGPRASSPAPILFAALAPTQRPMATAYCDATFERTVCDTPLVVAFDGEPIAFVDHWPTATTPWLALDRNGDGAITSRAELFGDSTILPSGNRASNGFIALAALDDNHDAVIDRRDRAFSRLLLWADRDANQTSSPSELRPASDVVVQIPLANVMDPRCTADDDCEGERGTLTWRGSDGSPRTGAVVDVYIH